ncbi:MAG: haloacid dehalogenase-like hydrolase [Rhodobacteraceae bacterium]|nr:haloacid dehalogenase-like hydrolase [Paracoccaceae bacterium]
MRRVLALSACVALLALPAMADPLPSWNDTDSKARIIAFVDAVTDPTGDDFVPTADRIAVFDNDGTLWAEQPVYFQLLYAIDRLGDADPSTLTTPALQAAAAGDMSGVMAEGEEGILEVIHATHSGMTVDAFQADVAAWAETATNPATGMAYTDMTYQPMVELLRYLRDEGFVTYIVSGGGVHFIRALAEDAYGIPPRQVIGSLLASEYQVTEDGPQIVKLPEVAFIDDKEGKPVAIDRIIGARPILAGGNSDGDFAMLEWTTAGDGPRMGLLVHHTDGDRAFAYDRDSHIGRLERGLDEGPERGWVIVDMAQDWSRIWTGTPE